MTESKVREAGIRVETREGRVVDDMIRMAPSLSRFGGLLEEAYHVYDGAIIVEDGEVRVDRDAISSFLDRLKPSEEEFLTRSVEVEDPRSPLNGKTPLAFIRTRVEYSKS